MNAPNLTIDSIRINYIFSYYIGAKKQTSGNTSERIILKWNIKKNQVALKDRLKQTILEKNVYTSFEYHESEEYEPLNVRSAIYFPFPHFSISKAWSSILIDFPFHPTKIEGKLQIHLAIFETGMGLMWVSIQFDDSLPSNEIYNINQRKNLPHITYEGVDTVERLSIHELYNTEINQLVEIFNSALNEQIPEIKYYWDSKFWCDTSNAYERGQRVFQEPSIAILIKAKEYLELFEKSDEQFQLLISSILHGVNLNSIDISHAKEHTGYNCNNLYSTKKYLTNLHGNCLLVFHYDDYENTTTNIEKYNSFKEFTYGLFRTYCAVRGTWHIYNLLNEEIDCELEKLNEKIDQGGIDVDMATEIRKYILLKSHFLQVFNSEDPFVRGIGLTPFSKLYEYAIEIYKSNLIVENIKYKLKEYDSLIHSINTFNYFSTPINVIKQNKKRFFPILCFGLFLFALIIGVLQFKYNLIPNLIVSTLVFGILGITIFILFGILFITKKNRK